MDIRKISQEETLNIRSKILRPQAPIEDSKYTTDNIPGCYHLGAFVEEELVGIASVFPERLMGMTGEKHFRLRGMAVLPEVRSQGVGRALIENLLSSLKRNSANVLWCNARESAFGYYEKLGFKFYGGMFEIEGIGPHKKMYYLIKSSV